MGVCILGILFPLPSMAEVRQCIAQWYREDWQLIGINTNQYIDIHRGTIYSADPLEANYLEANYLC